MLNEKTIHLLGRYNRDQAAGMLCRILLAQPRFLGFAPYITRGFWKSKTEAGFQQRSETHEIAQGASRPETTQI